MGKLNVEPMITFPDGTELLVSTRYTGERQFICELFILGPLPKGSDGKDLRSVTLGLEASTCRQAQDIACGQARRLFPDHAAKIKEPPYLIWSGPNLPAVPENHGWRSRQ